MKRYQAPPTLSTAVLAYLESRGPLGASRSELVLACGSKTPNITQCLRKRLLPTGRVVVAGPDKRQRFFTDKAHAEAYAAGVPQMLLAAQADRRERQKLAQRKYERRMAREMQLTKESKAIEALRAAGAAGCDIAAINVATGSQSFSASLSRMIRAGKLYAAGPLKWRRYFADKADADKWEQEGATLRAQHLKDAYESRYERSKPAKRERDRKYRAAKSQAKEHPPVARGLAQTVTIKRPTPKDLSAARIVVPEGIRVYKCPSVTWDTRYQVRPGQRVIGELTAEWRQRRSV